MADLRNVRWLAGLLEGEGCFISQHHRNGPGPTRYMQAAIQLVMTDGDVVERAASVLGARFFKTKHITKGGKSTYRTVVHGPRAVGWMMMLWPLMGIRRRGKITSIINLWKSEGGRPNMVKYTKRYMPQEVIYG